MNKKNNIILYCGSFIIVFLIMVILFYILGYAPFGSSSLACMDAKIQYLDFFAYLKDVFTGHDSILYTFGKTLGGSNIAVYSYYLSSPFNFLVLFFDKQDLNSFFDIVVALKLGMAAMTMAFFLVHRLGGKLSFVYVLLLSMSYGLMQYNIAQSSNIMWLDGVYMLPLMLLGVYRIVQQQKISMLAISTGLAIIFNWYSAGINCVFTGFWFILEYMLLQVEKREKQRLIEKRKTRKKFKKIKKEHTVKVQSVSNIKIIMLYVGTMLWGIAISACLFFPSIIQLQSGKGHADWRAFNLTFDGDILSIIQNFTVGSISLDGSVSLFCGSLVLLGCISYFTSKRNCMEEKVVLGIFLVISVLFFYWQPLHFLFSLLKVASSYWYRYSYIVIFTIIFIASNYYLKLDKSKGKVEAWNLTKNTIAFSFLLCAITYFRPVYDIEYVAFTVMVTFLITIVNSLSMNLLSKKREKIVMVLLVFLVSFELMCNSVLLVKRYHVDNVEDFKNYTINTENQISQIKIEDIDNYRISQTTTRNMNERHLTANYNEALAYGYMSIAGYTSDPDNIQLAFLNKLGYRKNGSTFCIVDTSVLAADSLLGVKYILSPYQINGLELQKQFPVNNGKMVYKNPYCLPMAIVYKGQDLELIAENPFEYHNSLYSKLLNEPTNLYKKANFVKQEKDGNIFYTIKVPKGQFSLYGNIIWRQEMDANLYIGDSFVQGYSRWLSPSVFYIPTTNEDEEISIKLETKKDLAVVSEQFYALDLVKLKDAVTNIMSQDNGELQLDKNKINYSVTAESSEYIYLSIPYHKGWNIFRNGENIEPDLFGDCMMSIPLEEGENEINMTFEIVGLKESIFISIIAILGLFFYWRKEHYRCKK